MGEMKPALTAEQWVGVIPPDKDGIWGSGYLVVEEKHHMAAVCLHEQSFGFTREDVELLRETLPADVLHLGYQYEEEPQAYLLDLADRIEALLPPEDK